MAPKSLKLLIGGEAGDGVFATVDLIAKAFCRAGLHVFVSQVYSSRIRGGHIHATVRVSREPLPCQGDDPDVIIGLDENTVTLHAGEVRDGGTVLYDSTGGAVDPAIFRGRKVSLLPVPARQVAQKELRMPVMKNVVLAGAAFRALDFDPSHEILKGMVEEQFAHKGKAIVAKNLQAAGRGRDLVAAMDGARPLPLMKGKKKGHLYISGNEALALGAMAGGCRLIASYPITPATDILEYMVPRLPRLGGACVQAEDELSAVHMVIGSAWAGVRSMSSTSGAGLALMVEGLALASMTETPLVVVDVQRPGPSTGIPTKTEQGDLELLIFAAHGEAPRIVLAPSDVEECFRMGWEAFNLADRYQCPVLIALDQFLGQAKTSLKGLDTRAVRIHRGEMWNGNAGEYRPFADTPSGISPRSLPGLSDRIVKTTGLVHNEDGFPTGDPENRVKMIHKLWRKMEPLQEEMPGPEIHGDPKSETTLVAWGSTKGVILEAMDRLSKEGVSLRLLHFTHLWPLPRQKVREALASSPRIIAVECNLSGQLAHLLSREVQVEPERINHYDGTPLSPGGLHRLLKERLAP